MRQIVDDGDVALNESKTESKKLQQDLASKMTQNKQLLDTQTQQE